MCLGIRADVAVDNHILILRELLQPGYGHLGGVQHVQFQLLLNNLKKAERVKNRSEINQWLFLTISPMENE